VAQVVYTRRVVAAILPSAIATLYTVPAGNTFIVRCMTLGYNVAARASGNFLVMSTASNSIIWTGLLEASSRGTLFWNGMLALNPGEIIRASSSATGAPFLTVTGYLFELP